MTLLRVDILSDCVDWACWTVDIPAYCPRKYCSWLWASHSNPFTHERVHTTVHGMWSSLASSLIERYWTGILPSEKRQWLRWCSGWRYHEVDAFGIILHCTGEADPLTDFSTY